MISFVQGEVTDKLEESLILDVGGIGYEVRVTPRLWQAARMHTELRVYTHFHVREDNQVLFGFVDLDERAMFRMLLTVSGVGPKTAMAVLSAVTSEQLVQAVHNDDAAALKAPGVGPKLIKRLLTELKTIFEDRPVAQVAQPTLKSGPASVRRDTQDALLALGYSQQEIDELFRGFDWQTVSTEQALTVLLRTVSR